MRVGVISDTHGYLNPKVFEVFKEVEHIFLAGDIGSMDIIIHLNAIAPVTAVHGNMDPSDILLRYPEDQRVQLTGFDVFMTHNAAMLLRRPDVFRVRCGPKRPDVFIGGHTHRAENRIIEGMLSLNPGSAGKPMLDSPSSVGLLTLESGRSPHAEIVILET
ncbi:MAG: metallophosphoesterase family protein [Candidatus Lindowbacteria bacterium]|nr:metallophosphoesterase family protein [Candidatus Lindowbacteria bacterium]